MKAGWETKPLGDLCAFENGDRGKNYPGKKAMVPKGVPFINAGHLGDGAINWERMDHIPEHRYELLGSGKIKLGDILFCLRGSLGKFGVVRKDTLGAIASSLVIIRPSNIIDRSFLAYYFRSPLASKMIENYAGGAAQPNLSAKSLKAFLVPLPPLEEQQRIVAILDEAFERLDRAKANAEANLASARELFEVASSKLAADARQTAPTKKLNEIAHFRNGLNYSRHSTGETVAVVGVSDFGDNYELDTGNVGQVCIEGDLKPDDLLEPGDILAVRSNGNKALIGRTMLVPDHNQRLSFSGFTIRVRITEASIDPAFVCTILKTREVRDELTRGGGGANISNLNQGTLGRLEIPMLDGYAQDALVTKVSEMRDRCAKTEADFREKSQSVETLRQSLLAKAFAGELT